MLARFVKSTRYGFFFFSSRRRHTRLQGDWSSDVCSSDLVAIHQPEQVGDDRVDVVAPRRWGRGGGSFGSVLGPQARHVGLHGGIVPLLCERSEERRVGEECRSWGSTHHLKKKKV